MHHHGRELALFPSMNILYRLQANDGHEMHKKEHEDPRGSHPGEAQPSPKAPCRAVLTNQAEKQCQYQHGRQGGKHGRPVIQSAEAFHRIGLRIKQDKNIQIIHGDTYRPWIRKEGGIYTPKKKLQRHAC